MINGTVTFDGTNAAAVASTLDLYVQPHPTQSAIILFTYRNASDPLGVAAAGQTITVTDGKVTITGVPTGGNLPIPGPGSGGPNYLTSAQVAALLGDYVPRPNLAGGRPLVATRFAYSNNYGIGNVQGTSRVRHVATQACSGIRLLYGQPYSVDNAGVNQTHVKVGLEKTVTAATLSSALSTASAITSLPIAQLPVALPSGTVVTVTSGGNSQSWTLSASAAIGATTLTVTSQTPNFAYPSGAAATQQVVFPVTFNGRATGVIDVNGYLVSDPVAVELAAGEVFYSRCFGNTPLFNAGSNSAYVSSAAATTVGATSITSNTLIPNATPGQIVTVDQGGNAEQATLANPAVTGSSAPYTYNFTTALTKAHTSGAVFGQQVYANGQLFSDFGEGFTAGSDLSWVSTTLGVLGALSTTVVGNPAAGASTFQVAGSVAGDTLTIGTGGTQETVTVKNYQGGANPYTVTITGTLANAHSAGETVVSALTSSLGVMPLAIAADRTADNSGPVVVGVGDSIPNGTGNPRPAQSYLTIAIGDTKPYLTVTKAGELGATFANPAGSPLRRKLLSLATWAYIEYGTNDLYNGQTLAQAQATLQALCLLAKQRGLKVMVQTLTPRTTSTDLWTTASNQTVAGLNTNRVAYNDWLRAWQTNGLKGTYVDALADVADAVEVNSANTLTRNGGLWLVDNGDALSADGIHPSRKGHLKMATAVPVGTLV